MKTIIRTILWIMILAVIAGTVAVSILSCSEEWQQKWETPERVLNRDLVDPSINDLVHGFKMHPDTKRLMDQVDENNRLIKNLIQLHREKINE